jgi:hypothetical protein
MEIDRRLGEGTRSRVRPAVNCVRGAGRLDRLGPNDNASVTTLSLISDTRATEVGEFRRRAGDGLGGEGAISGARVALLPALGRLVLRRPGDSLALVVAIAAGLGVVVNASFLQSSRHPAPMFAEQSRPVAEATGSTATVTPRPRPPDLGARRFDTAPVARAGTRERPLADVTPHTDAIGDLITTSSRRLIAVQRALGDFGYGPVKPTGFPGPDTRAAIEKFERDRRIPVTGQISDRLIRELATVTGRSLE